MTIDLPERTLEHLAQSPDVLMVTSQEGTSLS